jgi:multidrug resistance protein, MATE family
MDRPASSTSQLIHLAWPVLVAQLAMMANVVIDTAMAGRLSAIALSPVGIAASIMSTVLMTLISGMKITGCAAKAIATFLRFV